jgi:hypothetical protein
MSVVSKMCGGRVEAVNLEVVVLICMHACVMSSWRSRVLSACGTPCLCGVSRMFGGISCKKLMSLTFVPALVHQFDHHVDLIHGSPVEVLAHIRR